MGQHAPQRANDLGTDLYLDEDGRCDVVTTEGDTLILFPFGRAVDVLQDQNGMQIHRSHWVALNQIDEVVSRDGRVTCQMIGGPALPVSRSYRAALKAARRGAV